ncbi:MAG: hypothetical protein V1841_02010 [Patescibacteria group bacterium]
MEESRKRYLNALNLLLGGNPEIEKIIKSARLDTATVNSALILMEIKGKIKRSGNKYFINR